MNIIDLVKNQLGGDVLGRIGGMLGIGNNDARSAVDAGIPALLAGLTGLAGTPDGARRLDAALDGVDDRVVGNLSGALSSGGASSIVDSGSKMLGSLFGNNTLSGLGGALSKFTGLGGGTITSLLGLLGPVVLGVLKGQRNKLGLDAGGLANLLLGQKNNIAAAMPSGLGSALSGIPGLSALTGAADTARAAAGSTVGSAYSTGRAAVQDTRYAAQRTGTSAAKWLVPLAAVLGLCGLVWWMANRNPTVTPSTAGAGTGAPRSSATPPVVTGDSAVTDSGQSVSQQVTRLTADVTRWFGDATTTLTDITDVDSANAALPTLGTMADRLEGFRGSVSTLPADARSTLATLIGEKWTALQTVLDKTTAIPGVGPVLQPALDRLRNAIAALRR